jgi:hypothetical protein
MLQNFSGWLSKNRDANPRTLGGDLNCACVAEFLLRFLDNQPKNYLDSKGYQSPG